MSVDLFDDPDLDRVLASGLSDLAPEIDAVDVRLEELRPRFHRARTRRRAVQASAAAAALLVVGSVMIAESPHARRAHVTVESPARRTEATQAQRPKHTSVSAPARHRKVTTTPKTAPAPTNPPRAFSSPATSAQAHTRIVASPTAPPTSPAVSPAPTHPSTPPSTAPAPVARRFWSTGGSIIVELRNGRLSLTTVSPARGYHADVQVRTPQLIEVRFTRNGRRTSEIGVGLRYGRMYQFDDHSDGGSTWRHLSSVSAPTHHTGTSQPTEWNWASGPARVSHSRSGDEQGEA